MVDPWQVGLDHEQSATNEERRRRGAWYTPRALVEGLVACAIDDTADPSELPAFIVDPTCGGGGFLLGVLDRLVVLGLSADDALSRVGGLDVDSGAVAATAAALAAWGRVHGATAVPHLAVRDALLAWPVDWARPDLIVGNPPFATPLKGRPFPANATEFRADRADLLGPYADLAAIHLANALEHVAQTGRVCLVLPQSLLAGRDAAGLRTRCAADAPAVQIWASSEAVFDAGVRVWAPVLQLGTDPGSARLSAGLGVDPVGSSSGTWAELVADALGTPTVRLDAAQSLGDRVTATAGFRDEYYGLSAACVEADDERDERPRLVTVGSLDPLRCDWGRTPLKIAKQTWRRPVVDVSQLEPKIARWLERQLVPKIVLPTQSKVFEPVIDRDGRLAPLTPVISIHVDAADLDLVAAMFLAPPVVAWARRRWFGTALSVEAIKLAARDVAVLPTPNDHDAWAEAASLVAETANSEDPREVVIEVARRMNEAYAAADEVFFWWLDRLA
ncbi:MAG: hypothetical protein ACI8TP_003686 [Acidimicrobiales bacterium]